MEDVKKTKKTEDTMDDQTTIITNRDKVSLDQQEQTDRITRDDKAAASSSDPGTGSASSFKIDGLTRKLKQEIDDIPELDLDEMATGYMSGIIKNIFPEKSREEQVGINRNFLADAEPFKLERLVEDIKSRPEGLSTGFSGLDQSLKIPNSALTIITASPRHGKSAFMMNLMLNMALLYREKHFLFFTYEDLRREVEIKIINMCGEKPFPAPAGESKTNLERWKHEFRHRDTGSLMEQAEQNPAYSGLKKFMEIAPRIHIIDNNYPVEELVDSINSFKNTFKLGAVFIDSLQGITAGHRAGNFSRHLQLEESATFLKKAAYRVKLPIICTVQFLSAAIGIPEYDILAIESVNTSENAGIYSAARLVIGLQDYSRSRFIGSNINDTFVSQLFGHKLLKAEKVQGSFDPLKSQTVILAKVLLNREGIEPEVELLFDKPLQKIRNLREEDIRLLKNHLV